MSRSHGSRTLPLQWSQGIRSPFKAYEYQLIFPSWLNDAPCHPCIHCSVWMAHTRVSRFLGEIFLVKWMLMRVFLTYRLGLLRKQHNRTFVQKTRGSRHSLLYPFIGRPRAFNVCIKRHPNWELLLEGGKQPLEAVQRWNHGTRTMIAWPSLSLLSIQSVRCVRLTSSKPLQCRWTLDVGPCTL